MQRLIIAILCAVCIFSIYAEQDDSQCEYCKGKGYSVQWVSCKTCKGTGYIEQLRTTKYRDRFAGTNVRKFNDGKAGTVTVRCRDCDHGMGKDKHRGKVKERVECKYCNGRGLKFVNKGTRRVEESRKTDSFSGDDDVTESQKEDANPVKEKIVVDADLELAKLNVNTNAFSSYRCKYRNKCEHCGKLYKKNQLTKSYCTNCYVCEQFREEVEKQAEKRRQDMQETEDLIKEYKSTMW